jgi:hypothetical protein
LAVALVPGLAVPPSNAGPRLEALPTTKRPVGMTPPLTRSALAKFHTYFGRPIDPEITLELVVGRPRLFPLKQRPFRIQLADPRVMEYNLIEDRLLALQGRAVGITILNLWFGDPTDRKRQQVLSIQVNVI